MDTPWHPRRFNQDVSEEFVEIIADMMEKEPSQRTGSAAEVAARLEPWALEASPILSGQMMRSRWTPPPLPTGLEDDQTTDVGLGDLEEYGSSSQTSQGTFPISYGGQETHHSRATRRIKPPPLKATLRRRRSASSLSRFTSIAIALAIAVPTALMAGIVIGFLLHAYFG
jgi:hypothetical protein